MLFRWRGIQSGNWSDGRNWVNENNVAYAEARYPGSIALTYDDVICDEALAPGAYGIAGYDGSADEKLKSLRIAEGYNGSVGSAATWLKVAVEPSGVFGDVSIEGGSEIYLESTATHGLNNIKILGGNVHLGGTLGNLTVLSRCRNGYTVRGYIPRSFCRLRRNHN